MSSFRVSPTLRWSVAKKPTGREVSTGREVPTGFSLLEDVPTGREASTGREGRNMPASRRDGVEATPAYRSTKV